MEQSSVTIVPYQPSYRTAFKALNEEWIRAYFEMEEADHKALDHPEEYILAKGGKIIVALHENEPVGVCALLKMEHPEFDYEMAKMAVAPKLQGKKIGWLLGQHIISIAKELGAKTVYLESNTRLVPAIKMYYKMGFQKLHGYTSPYKRSDIQMKLDLFKATTLQ